MKKLIIIALLVASAGTNVLAQTEPEETKNTEKTEFLADGTSSTGFGGPWMQVGFINGNAVPFFGGGGGALFNNQFYFGGFGMGMSSPLTVDNELNNPNLLPPQGDLTIGMGGMILGYTPWGNKKIHPIFGIDFGWGGYSLTYATTNTQFESGNFSTLTPRAGVEMNALPWLKFHLAGSYRVFSGINSTYISNNTLSSPLIELRLHFGWFGE